MIFVDCSIVDGIHPAYQLIKHCCIGVEPFDDDWLMHCWYGKHHFRIKVAKADVPEEHLQQHACTTFAAILRSVD